MRAQNTLGGPEIKCSPEEPAQNAIILEQQATRQCLHQQWEGPEKSLARLGKPPHILWPQESPQMGLSGEGSYGLQLWTGALSCAPSDLLAVGMC